MLLDATRNVTTNIKTAKTFSISENSTKLFAMLSNFLYKDKELSVLTELSSNALDAHAMLGKQDTPIEVTMPTPLVPEVTIRDFGPGMSKDNVYLFLTTYGESSKQADANAIGGFGIGSKSPAAVTDTWTIHSYHEGIHTQYLVFIDSHGIPSLTEIMSEDTTESGLAVSIPIKPGSTRLWESAVSSAYRAYPVKPIVHNFTGNIHSIKIAHDYGNFFLSERVTGYGRTGNVIINHRIYPINLNVIEDPVFNMLLRQPEVFLRFGSSELSVSLSREELQYDTKTINAIKARAKEALGHLKVDWDVQVAEAAVHEIQYSMYGTKFLDDRFQTSDLHMLYDKLGTGDKFFSQKYGYATKNIGFELSANPGILKYYIRGERVIKYKSQYTFFQYSPITSYKSKGDLSISLGKLDSVAFVEDDGKTSMVNLRVRQAYENNTSVNYVLIMDNFDFLHDFLKAKVVKISSLPKPVITKTSTEKREKIESIVYTKYQNQFRKVTKEDLDKIEARKKVVAYVVFTNASTTSSTLPEYSPYIEILAELNIEVIGVKDIKHAPRWTHHPKDALQLYYNNQIKVLADIQKIDYLNKIVTTYSKRFYVEMCRKLLFRTPSSSVWNELMHLIKDLIDSTKDSTSKYSQYYVNSYFANLDKIETALNITTNKVYDKTKKFKDKNEEVFKKVENTYPMLALVAGEFRNLTTHTTTDNIIMQYITLVGK